MPTQGMRVSLVRSLCSVAGLLVFSSAEDVAISSAGALVNADVHVQTSQRLVRRQSNEARTPPNGLVEGAGKGKDVETAVEAAAHLAERMQAEKDAALQAAKAAVASAEEAKRKADVAVKQLEQRKLEEQEKRKAAEKAAALEAARAKQARDEKLAREEQERLRAQAEKEKIAAKQKADKLAEELRQKAEREKEEVKRKAEEKARADTERANAEIAQKATDAAAKAAAVAAQAKEEMNQRLAAEARKLDAERQELKVRQDELDRKAKEAEERKQRLLGLLKPSLAPSQTEAAKAAEAKAKAEAEEQAKKAAAESAAHAKEVAKAASQASSPSIDYAKSGVAKPEEPQEQASSTRIRKISKKQAKAALEAFTKSMHMVDGVHGSGLHSAEADAMDRGMPSFDVVHKNLKARGLALTEQDEVGEPSSDDVIQNQDGIEDEIVSDVLKSAAKANPTNDHYKVEGLENETEDEAVNGTNGTSKSAGAGLRDTVGLRQLATLALIPLLAA